MKKHMHRSNSSGISAKQISLGRPAGVRSGGLRSAPAHQLSIGYCTGKRMGPNARLIGMGHPAGRKGFAEGGHATDMGFEEKGERLRKVRERNDILGSPHYARGGKVHQGMKAVYKALHSYFENDPTMKKLHVKKEQLYEGMPHRYVRSSKRSRS